jgi:hypothetical protein
MEQQYREGKRGKFSKKRRKEGRKTIGGKGVGRVYIEKGK